MSSKRSFTLQLNLDFWTLLSYSMDHQFLSLHLHQGYCFCIVNVIVQQVMIAGKHQEEGCKTSLSNLQRKALVHVGTDRSPWSLAMMRQSFLFVKRTHHHRSQSLLSISPLWAYSHKVQLYCPQNMSQLSLWIWAWTLQISQCLEWTVFWSWPIDRQYLDTHFQAFKYTWTYKSRVILWMCCIF